MKPYGCLFSIAIAKVIKKNEKWGMRNEELSLSYKKSLFSNKLFFISNC